MQKFIKVLVLSILLGGLSASGFVQASDVNKEKPKKEKKEKKQKVKKVKECSSESKAGSDED